MSGSTGSGAEEEVSTSLRELVLAFVVARVPLSRIPTLIKETTHIILRPFPNLDLRNDVSRRVVRRALALSMILQDMEFLLRLNTGDICLSGDAGDLPGRNKDVLTLSFTYFDSVEAVWRRHAALAALVIVKTNDAVVRHIERTSKYFTELNDKLLELGFQVCDEAFMPRLKKVVTDRAMFGVCTDLYSAQFVDEVIMEPVHRQHLADSSMLDQLSSDQLPLKV
ncbi:hypothetical protein DIPPA_12469 [Diplonema papillatum]|nr:hypothetical protein DIPPA_13856 [Diplonema papillatum]KAJ9456316.1 hypothetical protein DIPPA_12469 [Diplonema papillatum]